MVHFSPDLENFKLFLVEVRGGRDEAGGGGGGISGVSMLLPLKIFDTGLWEDAAGGKSDFLLFFLFVDFMLGSTLGKRWTP